jgi:hypothetical protein
MKTVRKTMRPVSARLGERLGIIPPKFVPRMNEADTN